MSSSLSQPGALRVAPRPTLPAQAGLESVAPPEPEKPYLARLVLLVPAEVISFYMMLKASAVNFLPLFGLICLALVILVRVKATAAGGKPEWKGVGISTVSFGLWLYATGGSLPGIPAPADEGIISVLVGVWTFLVPYYYTGTPSAKTNV